MAKKAKVSYQLYAEHKNNQTVHVTAQEKARWDNKDVAEVFNTKAEMDAWIAIPANVANFPVGGSFLIKANNVPDYWWDGTQAVEWESKQVDLNGYVKTINNKAVDSGTSNITLTTANVNDSANKRYVTDAQRTKIDNLNIVEKSNANRNIKINGTEVVVFEEEEITETAFNALTPAQQTAKDYIVIPD